MPKKLKICEFGSMLTLKQSPSLIVTILLSAAASTQTGICDQAATQFRNHRWPDAAEAYANCDKAAPGQTDALLYRGKALVNQQKFPGAAASLESYLATHPQSDDALCVLGYVRFRQDQPKESLALFTQAARRKAPAADEF